MFRLKSLAIGLAIIFSAMGCANADTPIAERRNWDEIAAKARGQTVYFNAWAGDTQTNDFIAWIGEEASRRYGVKLEHVKLKDTSEAVTRVVAEKAAGRDSGGTVDLIWINGPNFLAMRKQNLLFGPFATDLPNWRYVDTTTKLSNLIDFTVPVEGFEAPWRMAQIVFVYDSARTPLQDLPNSMAAMAPWAKSHPGRLTHPNVRNFLGATFLKQALYEFAPDPSVLQRPATDASFQEVTAPLWAWYDRLKPHLWRGGNEFPATGLAQEQLLGDGEIDLSISFNPAAAAVAIKNGTLPDSARVYVLERGTIGNTSFVAIPYNAAHKEGAMVVANLLLQPEVQARAQDPKTMGNFTVLDLAKLDPGQRQLFQRPADTVGLPTNAELGGALLEPHPSWMTRITDAWEKRYVK
ncbi:ABC transporter substrate-binding protein [Ferrovibrio xuzhouensis]|uniref:ABC transporter substrate-binding protein n=1 Tax=Ferrovibrio xuzhouensis TaxID=1576914 RepID=A0ABV7VJT5_9PROT